MILEKEYNRERAVMYARKFTLLQNPIFTSFSGIGGDCTNFVSQCVLAGSCVMNFTPTFGWYYLSLNRRSASWSGVEFFYNFMTQNTDIGPFAEERDIREAQIGDAIQLADETGDFYHTIIISEILENDILVCANSNDSLDRPLSSYNYASLRLIHFLGVRYDPRYIIDCFDSLYSQEGIPRNNANASQNDVTEQGEEENAPFIQETEMPPIEQQTPTEEQNQQILENDTQ